MFALSRSPAQLTPQELDAYLAQGWFRMGQTIFTTNFVHFKDEMYSTIWLRVLLSEYLADRTQIKLFKQNSIFRTAIRPAALNAEKEELYFRYQQALPFQTSESLQQLLYGKIEMSSIYNSYEVMVHHNDVLIAYGIFDISETSAAGITSVYDPAYKQYSLGKYLIYLKIQYCQNRKLRYFYPGYFVPGYIFFDYKLTIGRQALQFLQLSSNQWHGIDLFSPGCIPRQVMNEKLISMQKLLLYLNLESSIVKYEYFDANLIPDLRDSELLDFPIFLFCPSYSEDGLYLIIVYDVRDACYKLLMCLPIWQPETTNPDPSFYSAYYLKVTQEIVTSRTVEEMVSFFSKWIKGKK